MAVMKLIVGLGNPEDKFAGTRHNLGFEILNHLAHHLEAKWSHEEKFRSEVTKAKCQDEDVLLVKPQTYMNNSGLAVRLLADFYKISPEDIVIIHDDIDIKLGALKLRQGGSAAGHRGVESVTKEIGTDGFVRLRLGIGPEQKSGLAKMAEHHVNSFNVDKFVVAPFDAHEKSTVKRMTKRGVEAIEILLKSGLDKAQNQFH